MNLITRFLLILLTSLALAACGGSGGGDRAPGVEPGPEGPGGPTPEPPPTPEVPDPTLTKDHLTAADTLDLAITGLALGDTPAVTFTLEARGGRTVDGLEAGDLRASIAYLYDFNENDIQSWQPMVTRTEDPVCRSDSDIASNQCTTSSTETDPALVPDSARKVQDPAALGKAVVDQGTTESGGSLSQNDDGSYTYTLATALVDPATNMDMHRICFQFSLAPSVHNPCLDFIPADFLDSAIGDLATSLSDDFYSSYTSRQVVTQDTCNTCHDKLALHGGGRTDTNYCVTCHNPGSTDGNSGNTVDLAVLVHKLHFSKNLPRVTEGGAYKIWGYRNSEHDYSNVSYPQKMIHCSRCHAGEEDITFAEVQGLPMPAAVITPDGHNWVSKPSLPACTACHENLLAGIKLNGEAIGRDHSTFTDQSACAGCHRDRGADEPGGLQANQAHRDWVDEMGMALTTVIDSVTGTAAGETPVVNFHIEDATGNAVNLLDPDRVCADARFDLRIPYDAATEFVARLSSNGAPADLTDLGGNMYAVSPSAPVPDAVDTLAVMMDWHYLSDCADPASENVRLDSVTQYVASSAASPTARRTIVSVDNCNNCHQRFLPTTQKHGGTRAVNDPAACVACHNPEYASGSRTRELAVITHALHAAGMRENPHGPYDEDTVHYPGDLADCGSCHQGDSYQLPLPLHRQPIKVSRDDNTYTTAIAAVCQGCHDSATAQAHMAQAGGALFAVDYDTAAGVVESCEVCHRSGAIADIDAVHQ